MARFLWQRGGGWWILALLLGGPSLALATVVPHRTMEQMIRDAAHIVRGQVESRLFVWGPGRRHIYTEIRIKVLETLKGDAPATLIVRKVGGRMGAVSTVVPGSASYRKGEEVVVFLEVRRAAGHFFVMGLAAGKYQVLRREGQTWLRRNTHALSFHRPPGTAPSPNGSIYHLRYTEPPLSLAALRQAIVAARQKPAASTPRPATPTATKTSGLSPSSVRGKPSAAQQKRARMLEWLRRFRARRNTNDAKTARRVVRPGVVVRVRPPASRSREPGRLLAPPPRRVTSGKASTKATSKGGQR